MTSAKPYGIAKRTVWAAYQQVKANRGAAGVDDETIADFERDLSKNLYKLWNRMSSTADRLSESPWWLRPVSRPQPHTPRHRR